MCFIIYLPFQRDHKRLHFSEAITAVAVISYFSQLFFMPLCFSFIYIFPSLLSQRPRYSCYHMRWRHPWGFFELDRYVLTRTQSSSCSEPQELLSALFQSRTFKKVPPRNPTLGQLWCLCFAESARHCRRQQPALRHASHQPAF